MANHEQCKRAYYRSSKAYYANALKEKNVSVLVGMYHPDGGTTGEFEFEWVELGGKYCARLKSFEDSWSALSLFKDLLEKMAEIDDTGIQEQEFCEILDSLGILDITQYEQGKPRNQVSKQTKRLRSKSSHKRIV